MEFTGDGDGAAQQGADAEAIAEFRAVTGASENHAKQLLKESGGDLQAALQRFFVDDGPGQTSVQPSIFKCTCVSAATQP
eukprot:4365075-Pleurochrysis_carterae.AAC.1